MKDYANNKTTPSIKSRARAKWVYGLIIIMMVFPLSLLVYKFRHAFAKGMTAHKTAPIKKPAVPIKKKSEFNFYTLLPKANTTVIPTAPLAATYRLQISTFATLGQAKKQVAQLALSGHNAYIQPITLNQQSRYQVFTGPYTSRMQAQQAQTELTQQHLNPVLRRIKTPQ